MPSPLKEPEKTNMVIFREHSEVNHIGIDHEAEPNQAKMLIKCLNAIDNGKPNVTIVHKGNIMKYPEGGSRDWAYAPARKEFDAELIDDCPWCRFKNPKGGRDIFVKDYISDALAAQVGGIGIAPGANLSDTVVCFNATHGTASKHAGKDCVNPGSEILSAKMMLRHMSWKDTADLIIIALKKSIVSKKVTCNFARRMEGAAQVSCSGFGQVMIDNM